MLTIKEYLNDFTTEEFGQLFPIKIKDYNSNWPVIYQNESKLICNCFTRQEIISIDHIGSTAIPNIKAKPTIDVLLQVAADISIEKIELFFKSLNYNRIHQPSNLPPHITFVKGYSIEGYKGQAFHVHVRYKGNWNEIKFRDYLKNNPKVAKQYEVLKAKLAIKFKNDREAYSNAKTNFIERINALANS